MKALLLPIVFLLFLSVPVFATSFNGHATDDLQLNDGVNSTILIRIPIPCGISTAPSNLLLTLFTSGYNNVNYTSADVYYSLNNTWLQSDTDINDFQSIWSGLIYATTISLPYYGGSSWSGDIDLNEPISTCNGSVTLGLKLTDNYPSTFTSISQQYDNFATLGTNEFLDYENVWMHEAGGEDSDETLSSPFEPYAISWSDYTALLPEFFDGSSSWFNATLTSNDEIDSAWIVGIDANNYTLSNEGDTYYYSTVLPIGDYDIMFCADTMHGSYGCTNMTSYSVMLPPPPPFYMVIVSLIIGIGLFLFIFNAFRQGNFSINRLIEITVILVLGLAFIGMIMGML